MILAYEGARHFGELQARNRRDLMSARFNELLDEGAAIAESANTRSAAIATSALRDAYAALMVAYDAVITPPAAGEAPATLEQTGEPGVLHDLDAARRAGDHDTRSASVPRGLPLGLQIVGAHRDDDRPARRRGVVRIASAFLGQTTK